MMKVRSLLTALLAWPLGLLIAANAVHAQVPPAAPDLYALAKREGQLLIWSPIDAPALKQVAAVFNARYPGITLTHFDIQPGAAVERIVAESSAGAAKVDVVDGNIAYFKPLLDRNLLLAVNWQQLGVDSHYVVFDGKAVNHFDLEQPITINTQVIKPGEIKNWSDLLSPKYSGKIVLEARAAAFAVLSQTWGEQQAHDYVAGILKNKPIIIKGGTTALEALSGGQGAILLGGSPTKIEIYKKMGAPVDWLRVNPLPVLVYCTSVLRSAAHPNAAKLWISWLLSSQGQQAFLKYHNMGVTTGPAATGRGKEFQNLQIVRENLDATQDARLLAAFSRQIGSLN
jgi:iron(III) transport system substrate-binding protein